MHPLAQYVVMMVYHCAGQTGFVSSGQRNNCRLPPTYFHSAPVSMSCSANDPRASTTIPSYAQHGYLCDAPGVQLCPSPQPV